MAKNKVLFIALALACLDLGCTKLSARFPQAGEPPVGKFYDLTLHVVREEAAPDGAPVAEPAVDTNLKFACVTPSSADKLLNDYTQTRWAIQSVSLTPSSACAAENVPKE